MKKTLLHVGFLFLLLPVIGCTKTFATARTTEGTVYTKEFSATPNDLYYALRWVFKSYGYPVAEEDFQNGVIKSRYVPVGPVSHYTDVFGRRDYGVTGAYHQMEARLIPRGGKTGIQMVSRIQGIVRNIKTSGREEKMLLAKIADYLRSRHIQVTNQGVEGE